jgi:hypothetical protein
MPRSLAGAAAYGVAGRRYSDIAFKIREVPVLDRRPH